MTRQRESATIFVATQTARDLRQLGRQIGRNDIKSASVAYATKEELTVEQRASLESSRTVDKTMPALDVSRERVESRAAESAHHSIAWAASVPNKSRPALAIASGVLRAQRPPCSSDAAGVLQGMAAPALASRAATH